MKGYKIVKESLQMRYEVEWKETRLNDKEKERE